MAHSLTLSGAAYTSAPPSSPPWLWVGNNTPLLCYNSYSSCQTSLHSYIIIFFLVRVCSLP